MTASIDSTSIGWICTGILGFKPPNLPGHCDCQVRGIPSLIILDGTSGRAQLMLVRVFLEPANLVQS